MMAYPLSSPSQVNPHPPTDDTDKQPWFGGQSGVDNGRIQEVDDAPEELGTLRQVIANKVVVVHDAEKKFSPAALDIAINGHAKAEGDTILVLAYMEHFLCGWNKMIADEEMFGGANLPAIVQAVSRAKTKIASLCQRHSRVCQNRKIKLLIKVVPGANPKVKVAKEITDFQATCAVFDKRIITNNNKEFYTKKLSCTILQIGDDGRSVETILEAVPAIENTSAMPRSCSVSSSEPNSPSSSSSSLWSRLKSLGGSKRSTGSSRTSSSLGSSRNGVEEEDEFNPKSFPFDQV